MLSVSKRVGEPSSVIAQMGRFHDRQLGARVKPVIKLVMILVVDGLVRLIYFAIYQAILSHNLR